MNLLLIFDHELSPSNRIHLCDRRSQHLLQVLKVQAGSLVRIGVINGCMGIARVISVEGERTVCLELESPLDHPPPTPLPCQFVMALPRPKMMRRVLGKVWLAWGSRKFI